ncbi:hypothetical protein PINS_up000635 [Pythium insidiosum]|nr:hypothetical protein PINS_up000635 [Pythium insidiosum]
MQDDDDWDDAIWSTIDVDALAQRRHEQPPSVSPPAPSSGSSTITWSCLSCTLVNAPERTTCLVCQTPRGQHYSHAHATATTPASAASHSASTASSSARRTVQATLPFGQPSAGPSSSASSSAPSATTTAAATTPAPSSTASLYSTSTRPLFSSGPRQATSLQAPGRQQTRITATHPPTQRLSRRDEDDDDAPDARALLTRRAQGEDAAARKRYLELDAVPTAQRPPIDVEAAQTFVYPTNYSIREYQLTIAEKALYHNTLVSLPTGLGKTLIASVVMYNYYRWFPNGQIVFMAPTKPLVAQQIRACHEIMGISLSDTAELQGSVPPPVRAELWKSKRVFFCTPQSLQNDLQRGICRAERLVCLVIDEAHRATGNYAYCGVIQEVERKTKFFRVLALSATPGAKFDVIQDVIRNLRITHIESRSADDADVKRYTHARQEEVIKCSLSSHISEIKTLFLRVFERITGRLFSANILQHKDPDRLSRYYVLQMRERFRQSPNYHTNRSAEGDLGLLISLLHARDLLTGHGLSSFKEHIDGWVEEVQNPGKGVRVSWAKKEMLKSQEFQALQLGLVNAGGDITTTANANSHPKLLKLREVLHEHFQRHAAGNSSTRAIVFTQYRTSVTEIVKLLQPLSPLLKVQQFIGQGSSGKAKESKGQSQKVQQEIVRKFRAGEFNVLVATCIAEEGLDIGEVDLIVSFDALTSPVRMIQRMGRTGRKRVGKVIILVTEGDEERKLAKSVSAAKTVSRALTTFKSKFESLELGMLRREQNPAQRRMGNQRDVTRGN